MRMLLIAAALVGISITMVMADPVPPPPANVLPQTEDGLKALDTAQLKLLRRAVQSCPTPAVSGVNAINPERNPCVIQSTDKAVADSGDPALAAFHAKLPNSYRYDEHRPETVWRAMLQTH